MKEKSQEPIMDNLPDGDIDWGEISAFIEDMLEPDNRGRKGWKIIDDSNMTNNIQEKTLVVLHIICDDLYEYFYKRKNTHILIRM